MPVNRAYARGCHSGFYRKRASCEGPIEQPERGQRKLCKKSKCRNTFDRGLDLGPYHPTSTARSIPKTSTKPGLKSGVKDDRAHSRRVATGAPSRLRHRRRRRDQQRLTGPTRPIGARLRPDSRYRGERNHSQQTTPVRQRAPRLAYWGRDEVPVVSALCRNHIA